MNSLLLPPKLYIDTGYLIDIDKVRNNKPLNSKEQFRDAYAFIDTCIKVHHFGIIFNYEAPLDWVDGNATPDSAKEIAAVIDSAKLQYLFEGDRYIYTWEVLQQCQHQNSQIRIPEFQILPQWVPGKTYVPALWALANQVHGFLEKEDLLSNQNEAQPFPSDCLMQPAAEFINETFKFKKEKSNTYQERVNGYRDALMYDMEHPGEYSKDPKGWFVKWMKRYLRMDKIIKALNPDVDVDSLLQSIDKNQCPAVKLFWEVYGKRTSAGHSSKDNDVDDWAFLAVIPYADLVLADRGFRTFIHQGDRSLKEKVFSDPNEAVAVLKQWTNTTDS